MNNPSFLEMKLSLVASLEAILFVAPGPVTVEQIATALDISPQEVQKGLELLEDTYRNNLQDHGLSLQHLHGRYQLTTAPQAAFVIERFLGIEANARLSRAALETLAIIAYKQPITRPQIDAIRGVNSDGVIKSMLSKGLIQEAGRADAPGRPILYITTGEFMQYFGIKTLDELPSLDEDESDQGALIQEPKILKG
jgi:segregation and condensation protein B